MNRLDYTQSVVRTRVLEKDLLTREKFEQMIEANDINEVFRILKTTKYVTYLEALLSTMDYEQFLMEALKDEYQLIEELMLDSKVLSVLRLKYDFHNIKVLCKELFLKEDLTHLYSPLSSLNINQLKEQIKAEEIKKDHYALVAFDFIQRDFFETKDPQRIEIHLDHFYIKKLRELIQDLQIPLLDRYIIAKIDFINVLTVLRAKNQEKDLSFLEDVLLDGGDIEKEKLLYFLHDSLQNSLQQLKNETIGENLLEGLKEFASTGKLVGIERAKDNYLLELIDEARNIHFGPEPLIAYLLKKENEVKLLRMIFIAKLNNLSKVNVQKRMRKIYV